MIIKNEIPILEFDTENTAVIMPRHQNLDLHLPEKAVFAFMCEYVDEYAKEAGGRQVGIFESATKDYPIYVINHQGQDVCLVLAL